MHLSCLLVAQIEFVVRTEQCGRLPLLLGGISMGGATALLAARALKLRGLNIKQLVLVAPAG